MTMIKKEAEGNNVFRNEKREVRSWQDEEKKTEMKKKEDGRAFILRHEMNTHSKKMGRRMCQGRKFHGKVREIK